MAVFLMCVDPMEQDTVSTPTTKSGCAEVEGVVAID